MMNERRIITLDEIRAQTEPQIVEIPGFLPNTTIFVKLRAVDLTPHMLEFRIGNPLLAQAQKLAGEGLSRDEIAKRLDDGVDFQKVIPLLDIVARAALVEPTFADVTAIHPLSLWQKLKIFEYAGGLGELLPFC